MSTDDRSARAQRLLEGIGILGARVGVEGHEREIAAIRVPAGLWEEVMADRVRISALVAGAGFRYVALDLRPADGPA
jgi:PP-loop superfamily ATP-utilizing enzyme